VHNEKSLETKASKKKLQPLKTSRAESETKADLFMKTNNYEELKEMVTLALSGGHEYNSFVNPKATSKFGKTQEIKLANISEKMLKNEIRDSKFMPTMREIKYLFEKLVGNKYDKEMRPDYEKQLDEDLTKQATEIIKEVVERKLNNAKPIPIRSITQRMMQDYHKVSKRKLLEFAHDIDRNKPKDHKNKDFKLTYKHGTESEWSDSEAGKTLNNSSVATPMNLKAVLRSKNLTPQEALEKRLSTGSKIKTENIAKKDLESGGDAYKYYNESNNYQDDIPFDLYNMVELAKRVSKPYTIPKVGNLGEKDRALMRDRSKYYGEDTAKHEAAKAKRESNNELNMILNPLKYINKI
jgi:hypothetical protein